MRNRHRVHRWRRLLAIGSVRPVAGADWNPQLESGRHAGARRPPPPRSIAASTWSVIRRAGLETAYRTTPHRRLRLVGLRDVRRAGVLAGGSRLAKRSGSPGTPGCRSRGNATRRGRGTGREGCKALRNGGTGPGSGSGSRCRRVDEEPDPPTPTGRTLGRRPGMDKLASVAGEDRWLGAEGAAGLRPPTTVATRYSPPGRCRPG